MYDDLWHLQTSQLKVCGLLYDTKKLARVPPVKVVVFVFIRTRSSGGYRRGRGR